MQHISVCSIINGERVAYIVSAETFTKAEKFAERDKKRIGYRGNKTLAEAVKRCGMMERGEHGAWGPLD